jgi:hypothetical protein
MLHILSDLHLEFARFETPHTWADVIVLAGDIGKGTAAAIALSITAAEAGLCSTTTINSVFRHCSSILILARLFMREREGLYSFSTFKWREFSN